MKVLVLALVCLIALNSTIWAQDSQQTITIPKAEYDALKARLDQLEQDAAELKGQAPAQSAEELPPAEEIPTPAEEPTPGQAGGRALQLPDISVIVNAAGKLCDDKRDEAREKLELNEVELGIQGYVYPNVKFDAFIAMSPAEGEAANAEEAYLTYQGLREGLNLNVGEKRVPFGRTNLLHPHSWLYARQPLVLSSFVGPEGLAGQGANLSYIVPTGGDLFVQLDAGFWANGSEGEASDLPNIMSGPGANLTDRLTTARLWTSYPITETGELELGGSWASGNSEEDPDTLETDDVRLTNLDLSYRWFGEANRRLLLRGELFGRRGTTESNGDTAKGYYLFGDYRWSKYGSVGLLYDWSEFPQDISLRESALSLIYTKQFSERYYLRFQATRGSRPGEDRYNEVWLQWVWGVGPHTHNLE